MVMQQNQLGRIEGVWGARCADRQVLEYALRAWLLNDGERRVPVSLMIGHAGPGEITLAVHANLLRVRYPLCRDEFGHDRIIGPMWLEEPEPGWLPDIGGDSQIHVHLMLAGSGMARARCRRCPLPGAPGGLKAWRCSA